MSAVGGRGAAAWFGVMILAILNGGIRESMLVPRFGSHTAHIISTLMLAAIILAAAYITIPWIAPPGFRDAVSVGLLWLALTLAFEFLAGRYVFGRSWPDLLAEYDVSTGRIWPLIPLVTLVAPPFAFTRIPKGIAP